MICFWSVAEKRADFIFNKGFFCHCSGENFQTFQLGDWGSLSRERFLSLLFLCFFSILWDDNYLQILVHYVGGKRVVILFILE